MALFDLLILGGINMNNKHTKRTFALLLALTLTIGMLSGCGVQSEKDKIIGEFYENVDEIMNNKQKESSEPFNKEATISLDDIDIDSIDFVEVNCAEFCKEIDENPLRKEKYLNQYVAVSGYCEKLFSNLDGERRFLSVEPSRVTSKVGNASSSYQLGDDTITKRDFFCLVLSSEQARILDTYRAGYEITVYGKITAFHDSTDSIALEILKVAPYTGEESIEKIDFLEVSADELDNSYINMGVDETFSYYAGKYIKLTGVIGNISEYDFSVESPDDYYSSIRIEYQSDEQKNVMMDKKDGDLITVWGRIDHINMYVDGLAISVRFHIDTLKIE